MHVEPEAKSALRYVAGGYVQVVGIDYPRLMTKWYDDFNNRIENSLRPKSEREDIGAFGFKALSSILGLRGSRQSWRLACGSGFLLEPEERTSPSPVGRN
jgi:hypothetical protein